MDRFRNLVGIVVLISGGLAVGCGGASEAGPRRKPSSTSPGIKVFPEAAYNTPSRGTHPVKVTDSTAPNGTQSR
jgi:hypothetical protein